jgi:hypothetical protein
LYLFLLSLQQKTKVIKKRVLHGLGFWLGRKKNSLQVARPNWIMKLPSLAHQYLHTRMSRSLLRHDHFHIRC